MAAFEVITEVKEIRFEFENPKPEPESETFL
jgi:hypothetical protein